MSHNQQVQRVCENCGGDFKVSPSKVVNNRGKYCSKYCLYSSELMKNVAINMGRMNKGKPKLPFTEEHRNNMRLAQIKKHVRVLCNHAYKDEWGKVKICKEYRKRYRKTCGGHINGTKQRYFCSIINPNYCIDITL